jgi:tetratricopeptide (TPR) repeat protein
MSQLESQLPDREQRLVQALRQALQEQQQDPANPMPAYNCGLIFTQLGDLEGAEASYRAAVDRNPAFFQAYYNLALVCSAQGRWDEAALAYRQGLQHNGADPEGWANLGAAYERLGKDDDALTAYQRALELNPQESQARVRIGQIHCRRGAWSNALTIFDAATTLNEQDWEAWNGLGLVHYHQGQQDLARAAYLKCLAINDQCAEAYSNLGNVFSKTGDLESAERAYRDAAQRAPKDADILFNLGELLFNQRNPDCERVLRRVVELRPDDYDAWELLRRWYPGHPDYPAWRRALETLLTQRPQDVELLRELAGVAERLNDLTTTLDALRRLVELDRADQDAHLFITRVHLKQDLLLEAYRHITLVDRVDAETLALWKHIGQRLQHHGHLEEAETCYLKVVAHRELEVDLWQALGEMAYGRGDWEVAYERYAKAEPVTRNNWSLWKPLADRFLEANQPTRATQCLDFLADLWPHLPDRWRYGLGVWRTSGRARVFVEKLEAMLDEADATPRLWRELARLWEEEGAQDRARACLARARRGKALAEGETLDPLPPLAPEPIAEPAAPADTPAGILSVARAALEQGDPEGALEHLKRWVTVDSSGTDPSRAEYFMLRGEAAYILGRLSEARDAFQNAVALDPKLFRGWFKLGNVLFREQRIMEAEHAFAKGTLLEPNEPKVWYNLGVAQADLKRMESAQDSFRRALALQRRFSAAWNWLGIVHMHRDELRLARRCFLRCIATQRRSANGWFNLGMLYQRLGRTAESERCLAEAEKLGGAVASEGVVPVKLFSTRDPREAGPKGAF